MDEILNKIDSANHVVVISHVKPDADSIGAASAVYTYLLQKHKKVSWYCKTEKINPKLSFIPWFDKIRNTFPSSADLAIALDCGNEKRLGVEIKCDLINIDHHQGNNNYATLNLVKPTAISTTEILFYFFKQNSIKINKKMATALYAGLLDDSECFIGESVDGTTFAVVEELINCGAEFKICNKNIMKSVSLAALRLQSVMLKNMTLEVDAKVAVFCVSNEDMKATGATTRDCGFALKESMYLPLVEVAMLLKQNSDGTIKGSLRCKENIDASKIASNFDGGGHKSRAGFIMSSIVSLEIAKAEVLNLIKKEI